MVPYDREAVPFATDMTVDYQIQDQRFAARRPDVLVYQTAPLAEDLTIAGPIDPSLWVSTTGTDADFVVKLIDVFPGRPDAAPTGTELRPGDVMARLSELLRATCSEPSSGTASNGPSPPTGPGHQGGVRAGRRSTRSGSGHRLMVQIQSSWFPLIDRNPQTFVDIYHAKPGDYRKATMRVFRSAPLDSHVTVHVLPSDPAGAGGGPLTDSACETSEIADRQGRARSCPRSRPSRP